MQEALDDIVARCLRETGADRVSPQAREVALVGILVAPDGSIGKREFRRRIKETYLKQAPEYGSFFLLVILPILVSLISHWIARWMFDQERTTMRRLRSQAFDALSKSSPLWTATPTSIDSPPKTQTEQSK
jgi:hypothetical protein